MNVENFNFETWALLWLETYKSGMVKDNSYWGTYHNPVVKHLIPHFGNRKLADIKPLDVQIYFKSLQNSYALETQRKIRAALNAIFVTAMENELCEKNPVTSTLKLKSNVPEPTKKAYNEEQYKIVWNFALKHPYGLSILLLMELGISRSELLGISWDNIDIEKQTITLTDGTVSQKNLKTGHWEVVTNGLKTKYRHRILPISKTIVDIIRDTPKSKSGYLISSPRGNVYRPELWYRRCYKRFMNDLLSQYPDIPYLTPHELRHTRASLWYDKGISLLDIAYLGGWCDLEMLRKRYYHVNVEDLRDRMKILK